VKKISPIFVALLAVTVLGGVLCTLGGRTVVTIGAVLLVFGGWAVSLCLHEFGHAIVAFRGGDFAVRHKGYLTLDPRKYTDPVFSILLPLLFVAIGGIPLPGGAVWINHHALRNKKVESAVSVAGPGANLLIGVIITLVVGRLMSSGTIIGTTALGAALTYLALLQVLAFIINILPVPGLDGWGAIEPWLSPQAQEFGAKVRPYAPLALFVILFAVPGAGQALYQATGWVLGLFGGNFNAAIVGQYLAMPWR
jgi:Zn-dependent protease